LAALLDQTEKKIRCASTCAVYLFHDFKKKKKKKKWTIDSVTNCYLLWAKKPKRKEKNLYSVHGSLPGRLNRKKERKFS
jgi:hypothetical protein